MPFGVRRVSAVSDEGKATEGRYAGKGHGRALRAQDGPLASWREQAVQGGTRPLVEEATVACYDREEQSRQFTQVKAGRKARRAARTHDEDHLTMSEYQYYEFLAVGHRWMSGSAPSFVRYQREHGSPRRVSLTSTTGVTSAETPPC